MYNGCFLPKRSRRGPYKNWPTEMPMKKLERESDTWATVVLRCAAMAGKPGRYISIEKGPMADKTPRIRISLFLLDMQLKYMLIIRAILLSDANTLPGIARITRMLYCSCCADFGSQA